MRDPGGPFQGSWAHPCPPGPQVRIPGPGLSALAHFLFVEKGSILSQGRGFPPVPQHQTPACEPSSLRCWGEVEGPQEPPRACDLGHIWSHQVRRGRCAG